MTTRVTTTTEQRRTPDKGLAIASDPTTVVDADGKVIDREKLVFAPGEIDPLSTVDLDDDDHEGHDHG